MKIENPTDPSYGLSKKQVITSEKNVILSKMSKSYKSIFLEHTFTLFNIINFALAALVIYTGSLRNMLFLGVVLINMAVGLFQELRSKRVLDKLALINQPKAMVVREGQKQEIPVDEVVKNDILILGTGNQVCCDCIIVEGFVECNESMLTGESIPIKKQAGHEIYAGTFIVSGLAKAQVTAVGEHTFSYSVLKEAKRHKRYPSQLRDSIQAIIRFSTIILFPAGILLFFKQFLLSQDLNESILNTVAAVVGMIPEGLVFLTSVALAAASVRLAHEKVLVQELYCIETLARVDTLCLDKTGTITEGKMKVTGVETFHGYSLEQVRRILANLYHILPDESPTALAIQEYTPFYNLEEAQEIFPFSSARKYAAARFGNTLYLCGAYTYLFDEPKEDVLQKIQEQSSLGMRVIALAKEENGERVLLALVFIEDVLRKDAKEILQYFYSQDVNIKIISGDDPSTVAALGKRAGVSGASIDMKHITTQEQMKKAVEEYNIFGRVSPEQKKEMVALLKENGHVVAMTGDGVNDVMALKEADCSIAMGSGSQAAKSVSSLVLLKDQFSALPSIMKQGRCVINNISRTASLFLVKTFFSLGLSILTLFFLAEYPFQPIQLTLISSLCTGLPSFILTLEPNESRVEGNFLKKVFSKALPGATNVICMVLVVHFMGRYIFQYSSDEVSTICTILAGVNALLVLTSVCQPMTQIRKILVISMSVVFVYCVVFIPQTFLMVRLDWVAWICTLALALILPYTLRKFSAVSWEKVIHFFHLDKV
jgi:cation-transporting ATPase E